MTTTLPDPEQEGISCSLTATSTSIKITCTNSNSLISGVQFIAQSSNMKEKEKLYVSERSDIDTMAEIALMINGVISGTYQITAFGIGINSRMIDSLVYTDRVTITSMLYNYLTV